MHFNSNPTRPPPSPQSPILFIANYRTIKYVDGSDVHVCLTQALDAWTVTYFLMTIALFFGLPLAILVVLYTIISRHLIAGDGAALMMRPANSKPEHSQRARRQVVMMLGAVVVSFFLCLLPFRVFTLLVILVADEHWKLLSLEHYYNMLYFCRVMVYLNSAVNPILYNLMSSKFRKGFRRVCCGCLCGCWYCRTAAAAEAAAANGAANDVRQTTRFGRRRGAMAGAERATASNGTTATTSSFLTHSSTCSATATTALAVATPIRSDAVTKTTSLEEVCTGRSRQLQRTVSSEAPASEADALRKIALCNFGRQMRSLEVAGTECAQLRRQRSADGAGATAATVAERRQLLFEFRADGRRPRPTDDEGVSHTGW